MALRCGCENEADDIVFGLLHRCSTDPRPPADLPRFVPSSRFVALRQDPCPVTHVTLPDPRYDENPIHLLLSREELED